MKRIFLILIVVLLTYSQDSTTVGQLTNISTISNTDLFLLEQSDSTRNVTFKQVKDSIYSKISGDATVDTGGVISRKYGVRAVSANYTLLATDDYVNVTTAAGTISIVLPITGIDDGQTFYVKKADSGAGHVSITVSGGGTIDGASSLSIYYQYTSYRLVKSGSNYLIF